jgi:mono/diheme cytochrome c family protein
VRNPLVKISVVLSAIGGVTVSRILAAEQATAVTEDANAGAKEEKVIAENCEICHSDALIRQQHLNENAWFAELQKMKSWGSPIETEQLKPLADYLATLYRVEGTPYTAQTMPANEELNLYKREAKGPPGNAARGKSLFAEACSNCHGPDARGGIGPELVAIPDLWRWNDFNAVVVHGRHRMPQFGHVMDTQQTADILAWLRTLRVKPEE